MTYYILVDEALCCLCFGGHDECLAQAADYCRSNPSEELSLLRFRGGEAKGRCVYRIDCSGYKQEYPPKFIHKARISKQGRPSGAGDE